MEKKTKNKFIFGYLFLALMTLLVFSISSGTTTNYMSLSPETLTFSKTESTQTFTIKNLNQDYSMNVTFGDSLILIPIGTSNLEVTFNQNSDFNLNPEQVKEISANINLDSLPSSLPLGVFTQKKSITAFNETIEEESEDSIININETKELNLDFLNSFCKYGTLDDNRDLEITRARITNLGRGDNNEWKPLDTLEVEVEFKNDREDTIENRLDKVILELGLFKKGSTTNIISEMIWLSNDEEEVNLGRVRGGERKTHIFKFRIDPSAMDFGDYILVVKAYPDGGEDEFCVDFSTDSTSKGFGGNSFTSSFKGDYKGYFAELILDKESDEDNMIIVDDDSYPNLIEVRCGDYVSLTADIYNIGDIDFEEQVKVVLYNSELGIFEEEVIPRGLYEGDKESVSFAFNIPRNATEKQYTLSMKTYYDYDEDNDRYDLSSDKTFEALLKVEGNCIIRPNIEIFPSLVSEAKAGEEVVIKVLLSNKADNSRSFNVGVSGYETWAGISELPELVFLEGGEMKEVFIKLNVNKDVSGEKGFNVNVFSDGSFIGTEYISFNIEKRKGLFDFSGTTGFVISGEDAYLWGLGLLNILLILIIVFVAIRIARRKNKDKPKPDTKSSSKSGSN
ncbi:putative S-layer protein [Patescibacteria group bacterium]|nr:putative S-layer protein [Patescibacteria group bacterium]